MGYITQITQIWGEKSKSLLETASVITSPLKGHASSNSFKTFNLYLYYIQPLLTWEE